MIKTFLAVAAAIVMAAPALSAVAQEPEQTFVPLPTIEHNTVAPRIVYVENPRFPKFTDAELKTVVETAAELVKAHFGITVVPPKAIPRRDIDPIFSKLVAEKLPFMDDIIGDFRHDAVAWDVVKKNLVAQIEKQTDPLDTQIAFAKPYLTASVATQDADGFAAAVTDTFKTRLSYWTKAKLSDGYPMIGTVPGRPDLPLNEYGFWTFLARQGIDAEIVLTNQLIASVEYMPVPVHTSLRGGVTGGSTEYNPASSLGATVWMTLFPVVSNDPQMTALRNGETYTRADALRYAAVLLAHEMGHLLLQLGHPWSNSACLMRPVEALDFAAWAKALDPAQCAVGSSAAMQPGVVAPPVW